jgi:HPt (histidine-containing phosphotransfer) domain-containing protein
VSGRLYALFQVLVSGVSARAQFRPAGHPCTRLQRTHEVDDGFVALEVLMEPEDVDAVLERSVPASPAELGTTHMEASVDQEVLERLRRLQGEDDPDIVAELTGMFLKDARSRLEAVEEALQKGDAPALERAAHELKGGSGTMGARGMSGLCAQLEDVGASGDLSPAPELLGRIREELGRVERALEAEASGNR